MIVSFSVQNFRSIRDKVTLDFRATSDKHQEEYFVVELPKPKLRVLKMAMIYGANASGKTNILRALDFLQDLILFPSQDKSMALNIPFFALDQDKETEFEIEFFHENTLYDYKLSLKRNTIQSEELYYYPKGKKSLVFNRIFKSSTGYEYTWSEKLFRRSTKEYLELAIQNQAILARISSIEDSSPLQSAQDWFRIGLMPLLYPSFDLLQYTNQLLVNQGTDTEVLKQFILTFLKRADFMISDIEISEEEVDPSQVPSQVKQKLLSNPVPNAKPTFIKYNFGFVHQLSDGAYTLELNDESFGTQRYYGLGAILMNLIFQDVVMPIDEIESSLHNDLLFHFIAMFLKNSKQGQLIFTSHNTALLNEKEIIRRDCVWITDRKADGSTELTPVSDYPVRKEHSLASLFKKGLIGGKPNLGSINLEDIDEQAQKTEN